MILNLSLRFEVITTTCIDAAVRINTKYGQFSFEISLRSCLLRCCTYGIAPANDAAVTAVVDLFVERLLLLSLIHI